MKVLIVDDEPHIRGYFVRRFALEGWTAQAAASSAEALKAISSGAFDCALVDVRLGPDDDGVRLAATLKTKAPLRVVMMSAETDNAPRVAEAGLGEMLHKPFDFHELLARLQ